MNYYFIKKLKIHIINMKRIMMDYCFLKLIQISKSMKMYLNKYKISLMIQKY